ncbi:MAG: hypothetical protein ABIS86_22330 [Streptosporangiaceae bacterium]
MSSSATKKLKKKPSSSTTDTRTGSKSTNATKPRALTAMEQKKADANAKWAAKREAKKAEQEAKGTRKRGLEEAGPEGRPTKRLRSADTANRLPVREAVVTPPSSQDTDPDSVEAEAEVMELEIQPHPDLPVGKVVRLLPYLVVKEDKIASLSFGRMRTPSPHGSRMGDHTGSWASVVDEVHSLLYGLSLRGAMEALSDAQDTAEAWMGKPDSVGMKLFSLLDPDDAQSRLPVLGEYASQVETLLIEVGRILDLDDATEAQMEEATEHLASAIAHHLAFQNFLPFATVPAQSAKGSTGSGEPAARAAVLRLESAAEDERQRESLLENESPTEKDAREKAEKAALDKLDREDRAAHTGERSKDRTLRIDQEEAQRLQDEADAVVRAKEGLWGLFSFEAALREAGIELAVSPAKIKEDRGRIRLAVAAAEELTGMFAPYENPKTTGSMRSKNFVPKIPAASAADFDARLVRLEGEAMKIRDADTGYPEVRKLSDVIRETAALMREVSGQASATAVDNIAAGRRKIEYLTPIAADILESLTAAPEHAQSRCAYVLGSLCHEHQTRMAKSYPDAVDKTEFLGDDPRMALLDELRVQIYEHARDFEPDAVESLLEVVRKLYSSFGAKPRTAESTRWVVDAKTAGLVVSFTGNTMRIQGRAPAPYGVGGMGSHSTAWVTEVGVVEQMLTQHGKDGLADALQDLTKEDLKGDLLKLDWLLARDQLSGGQLNSIFDNAVAVLNADKPEDVVHAYLCFRNVLPYATVDAGNRRGDGERKNASEDKVLDDKSLTYAAEQKKGEFDDDRIKGTITAMTRAVTALEDVLASDVADNVAAMALAKKATDAGLETFPAPPQNWASAVEIKTAVEASADRLTSYAASLKKANDRGRSVTYDVEATVLKIRKAEHTTVYRMALGLPSIS